MRFSCHIPLLFRSYCFPILFLAVAAIFHHCFNLICLPSLFLFGRGGCICQILLVFSSCLFCMFLAVAVIFCYCSDLLFSLFVFVGL